MDEREYPEDKFDIVEGDFTYNNGNHSWLLPEKSKPKLTLSIKINL